MLIKPTIGSWVVASMLLMFVFTEVVTVVQTKLTERVTTQPNIFDQFDSEAEAAKPVTGLAVLNSNGVSKVEPTETE